jgi:hypothetical protein
MIHQVLDFGFDLLARFWPVALAVCVVAFILVVMIIAKMSRSSKSVQRADKKGGPSAAGAAKHNNHVMNSLYRLPEEQYRCYHEVFVPRLDGEGTTRIHHLILSQYGIFVLQVQHECGEISGSAGEREWMARQKDGMRRFTNPILRNAYHIKALAKHLGIQESLFHSIVIFDAEVCFEMTPPRHVLTVGLGREITAHTTMTITPEVLDRVAESLRERDMSLDLEARRKDHYKARNNRLKHTHDRVE